MQRSAPTAAVGDAWRAAAPVINAEGSPKARASSHQTRCGIARRARVCVETMLRQPRRLAAPPPSAALLRPEDTRHALPPAYGLPGPQIPREPGRSIGKALPPPPAPVVAAGGPVRPTLGCSLELRR